MLAADGVRSGYPDRELNSADEILNVSTENVRIGLAADQGVELGIRALLEPLTPAGDDCF
jgi:hypothetical protein